MMQQTNKRKEALPPTPPPSAHRNGKHACVRRYYAPPNAHDWGGLVTTTTTPPPPPPPLSLCLSSCLPPSVLTFIKSTHSSTSTFATAPSSSVLLHCRPGLQAANTCVSWREKLNLALETGTASLAAAAMFWFHSQFTVIYVTGTYLPTLRKWRREKERGRSKIIARRDCRLMMCSW